MKIDIHSHVIPDRIVGAIAADPKRFRARIEGEGPARKIIHDQGYVYPLFEEFRQTEAKLDAMDRKGIDISVISPAPPMFYYWADADLALEVAGLVNDGVADMVGVKPARLRGMATVPMQHPDAAVAELERVVRAYGFKAVEIGTSIEGAQLAEERFRPLLRRASELNVFVFAHPYYVGAKSGLENYYLTNLIGNPLDTTVMLANLMFSGRLDELPDLKLVLAHGGGFAPYQIGRLVHGHAVRNEAKSISKSSPKDLLKRIYFDSLVFEPQALRYLIDLVGADHICIGTDAPFDMADVDPGATIEAVPAITPLERQCICCDTALKLLCEG
ncbi:aminocarboxymuconate-semialdehyde decarboxylase [Bradyrhizobium sacchari]|uniref:Aminocarboxymuconate-semialdehyde decarboxylase n=1 Tax=Bradyrhizobium sacchari TaxID=1399419 RepID=A0A560JQE3_9BRAD|nr:amidohydrolase family protein [Bradyrhizobium sacchari]OPY97045.1 aminocarboxymuconate-semialdehyde decarboxylase [Bradyrhizobium sacchari]TWB58791.1 aminocarboxymuconate-semialdehyde decarboxylase [Bradyrhizobium sacchari]TWB72849.1 aminocarboxymuconate-semialdehyde decarboxylase [Bradyrhizobium sacchari]